MCRAQQTCALTENMSYSSSLSSIASSSMSMGASSFSSSLSSLGRFTPAVWAGESAVESRAGGGASEAAAPGAVEVPGAPEKMDCCRLLG